MNRFLVAAALLSCNLAVAAPLKLAAPGLRAVGLEASFVDFLNEQLAQTLRESGMEVLTGREISAVVGLERQKQLLGCTETSCMAEMANALGVDGLVLGDVVQLDKKFQVSVKVVGAEDARVLAQDTERVEGKEGMVDGVMLAGRKMGPMLKTAAQLKAARTPPEQPKAAADEAPVAEAPRAGCEGWCEVDHFARALQDKTAFDLNAVCASAPNNAWAVGYGATVARFDGAKWVGKNAPADHGGIIRAIWSPSSQLAIAAGQDGLAYRYKGQGWAAIHDESGAYFYRVHGTPDGKVVWAATNKGILRLSGSAWTVAWAEGPANDVFAVSADEAWAVVKNHVLHFSGGMWRTVKEGEGAGLQAVWCNGANDVWFAGDNGLIVHHVPSAKGDSAWTKMKSGTASLLSLWGTGSANMWAAGTYGTLLHFDGEDWVAIPAPGGGTIYSVTGVGQNDVWFVQDLPNVRPGGAAYHYRNTP